MEKLVDLHIHSHQSDGQWTAKEIIEEVLQHNIETFAVCDHDTTAIVPEMLDVIGDYPELNYIKGVEVSVKWNGREYHILALNVDETSPKVEAIIAYNRNLRIEYEYGLIDFLNPKYPNITREDYNNYDYDTRQGGWKQYNYFKEKGMVSRLQDFFALAKGYHYVADFKSPEEVIPVLNQSGAVTILAHPPAYVKDDFYPIESLDYWRELGIQGLECYTQYTKDLANSQYYVDYCNQHGLYITGGSDCHGDFADRRLGYPHVTKSMIRLTI